MSKKLVVKRASVVALFKELGFKTADRWDSKKLLAKVKTLPDITDGVKIRKPKVRKALKAILAAKKIVIKSPDDEKEAVADKKATREVEGSKKRTTKEKAGRKEKGKTTKRGTGVVATILTAIRDHGPISKKQILARLVRAFPDRSEEGMAKTINVQVPSRLNSEKAARITKDDNGKYYCKASKKK